MLSFLAGAALVGLVAWFRARRVARAHAAEIAGIYHGFGAPDENGRIGWYRDNRYGSPFTDPDSPWREAGGLVGEALR